MVTFWQPPQHQMALSFCNLGRKVQPAAKASIPSFQQSRKQAAVLGCWYSLPKPPGHFPYFHWKEGSGFHLLTHQQSSIVKFHVWLFPSGLGGGRLLPHRPAAGTPERDRVAAPADGAGGAHQNVARGLAKPSS